LAVSQFLPSLFAALTSTSLEKNNAAATTPSSLHFYGFHRPVGATRTPLKLTTRQINDDTTGRGKLLLFNLMDRSLRGDGKRNLSKRKRDNVATTTSQKCRVFIALELVAFTG